MGNCGHFFDMKKYKLREHFTLEFKNELFYGPLVIELDEKTAALNIHKLDPVEEKPAAKGKKEKE